MNKVFQFYWSMKPFGFAGALNIMADRILQRISNRLDKYTIRNYEIVMECLQNGIEVKNEKDNIAVNYNINGKEFKSVLQKYGSDLPVFKQIILNQEYSETIKLIKKRNIQPKNMIDAGANVGLATIFFKAFFPELNVLAIEPSPSIYMRMQRNFSLNNLNAIQPQLSAIWSEKTKLHLDNTFRDRQDWATRTIPNNNGNNTVDAIDIDTAMSLVGAKKLDILKMDVEGAESEIFSNSKTVESWLPNVGFIVIEIHDEFHCRDRISRLMQEYGFELTNSHEFTIGVNKNYA